MYKRQVSVRDTVLRQSDLETADEMFITSTTREVLPITSIDGRAVNAGKPGALTIRLSKAFRTKALELSAR